MNKTTWVKNSKLLFLLAGFFVLLSPIAVRAAQPYEKIAVSQEWEVLKIVNQERTRAGKQPISMFPSLQKAADVRAKELITLFSHERPNGTACFTALDAQQIDYMSAGENIAAGQQNPAQVMDAWMHSPGHKANILAESFKHIGIGYTQGGSYGKNWAQLFVGGCSASGIEVNDAGSTSYPKGTSIDAMNRYLIITCAEHGTSYAPIVSGMCSGYQSGQTGTQTVTVNYQNQRVEMQISIGSGSDRAPAKVTGVKVSQKKATSLRLSWNKKSGSGYEIWRSTSKKGKYKRVKTISKSSTTGCRLTGLQSGTKYYFRVRAYRKVNGKKIYGPFSTVRSTSLS